jgi:acyl-CoA dehydrogenase
MEIPELVRDKISPRAMETLAKVKKFVEEEAMPASDEFHQWLSKRQDRWADHCPVIDKLKASAKAKGLWNLFLPKYYNEGAGFTNVEYGLMAEQMGRCMIAAEAMNCNAPDTGNMEVLARYANAEQKKEWLEPLLDGRIRSAFCMTEKGVASSDATNIRLSIKRDGDSWVLNGTKWWASGAGDPRCKLLLVMGKTTTSGSPYRQQSIIIVPRDTPGVKVVRPMMVFGYDDAPHGHMEIEFTNVRVPLKNVVWEEGRGFEIIQGRLGPGRIHHCMRSLGVAEEALGTMLERVTNPERVTFGKVLARHETINEWIARSRIEIDYARLLVLAAAHKMDVAGPKAALLDIAKAKIEVPNVSLRVLDRAIQAHGAEGVSQDQRLANAYAMNRTLRIADGPDEVHLYQLGRRTMAAHLKAKGIDASKL